MFLEMGDIDGDGDNKSEIVQAKNYYPFGLDHNYGENSAMSVLNAARNHRYKYNGKEQEKALGLNVTEMDWRQYDNALGRFNGIDKLAATEVFRTPYHFAGNNPVVFSDPSGLKRIAGSNSDMYDGIRGGYTSLHRNRASVNHWTDDVGLGGIYGFGGDSNFGIIDPISSVRSQKYKTKIGMFLTTLFGNNSNGEHSGAKWITIDTYAERGNSDYMFFDANREKEAYQLMRNLAANENNKALEMSAFVTQKGIFILPIDENGNNNTSHSSNDIKQRTNPARHYRKKNKWVAKSSQIFIRENGNKIGLQVLAEVHTHIIDNTDSYEDEIYSTYNGVPVYSLGPINIKLSVVFLFSKKVKKMNIYQKTIFNTENVLNGENSIINHSKSLLNERGTLIKK